MVGFMEESCVLLSMTPTDPRGRTEHVATFAVSATDPAAALYFIDVFHSSVFLNCISQVYFSIVFLTWQTETRDNICSVCN